MMHAILRFTCMNLSLTCYLHEIFTDVQVVSVFLPTHSGNPNERYLWYCAEPGADLNALLESGNMSVLSM